MDDEGFEHSGGGDFLADHESRLVVLLQTTFQILEINGQPPGPEDSGWEDNVIVTEGTEVVIAARFDSYANPDIPYMFHCHILDHEDTGMMGQFQVIEN